MTLDVTTPLLEIMVHLRRCEAEAFEDIELDYSE